MLSIRQGARLLRIQQVLARYGLDEFLSASPALRRLKLIFRLLPGKRVTDAPRGERIRLALQELGPIFVKFGQALSTRRDLLPLDIADELAKLQDQVPPFPAKVAREILTAAWGHDPDEILAEFEPEALAAASIAQVHAGRLKSGEHIVVKVLRPGMQEVIERDLDLLYGMAELALKHWEEGKRVRPVEVVQEYEKTVLDELDLMREAANASQLKRNFEGSDLLHVPAVYFDHCRKNVMVMERIFGVPISDMDTLRAANTNIKMLAENGVEIFFTQVFRHNFFHADMHPGNIFVKIEDPDKPQYAAVDFGIMGTLNPVDQSYLAGNFLAFFDRDYLRVAQLHIDSGWVPADTRVDELENAVRTVCEPIFNKPLSEISFAQVLIRLFDTARRFNMDVQPQLILLQKTLLNIEGLGRELYPDLDLWETAQPILREWMTERYGGRQAIRELRDQLPEVRDALRELPGIIKRVADGGDIGAGSSQKALAALQDSIEKTASRQRSFNLGGILAAASAGSYFLADMPWLASGLAIAAAVALFRSLAR